MTSVACRRTDSAAISDGVLGATLRGGVAAPREGCDDLLDEAHLPVGGRLERAQVPGLEAEVGELARRLGDDERIAVEVAGAGARADQAVLLELDQQLLGDLGDLEQLAAREAQVAGAPERLRGSAARPRSAPPWAPWARRSRWRAAPARGRSRRGGRRSPSAAGSGRAASQDVAQPRDVVGGELAVAGCGALGLDQALVLEEADLGDGHAREVRAQLVEHLPDVVAGAATRRPRLSRHSRISCPGEEKKTRRYLPIWTSSPSLSSTESMRSRLT